MVFMFHLHKERLSVRSELAANHVIQWHASEKCVEKTSAWMNVQLLNLVLCRWMVSNIFYLWTVASFWIGRKSSFSFSWRPECEKEVTEAWMWWQEAECVRRSRSGDYKRGFPLISLTDTLTFQQSRPGGVWCEPPGSERTTRCFLFLRSGGREKKTDKGIILRTFINNLFFFLKNHHGFSSWKFIINFQQHSFEKCKVTIQIFNRKKNKLTVEFSFFFCFFFQQFHIFFLQHLLMYCYSWTELIKSSYMLYCLVGEVFLLLNCLLK